MIKPDQQDEANSLVPLVLEIARHQDCNMRQMRLFLSNLDPDNESILAWLNEYKDSPNTRRIYHKTKMGHPKLYNKIKKWSFNLYKRKHF